jgi:hypothetical protein
VSEVVGKKGERFFSTFVIGKMSKQKTENRRERETRFDETNFAV